jgi:ubiquitin C-terminal hydrolase
MNQFAQNGTIYSLYGVVVHRGTSGQGHYLSYIFHQRNWYEVNDKKVTLVQEEMVLQQSAYMLFYELERKHTILLDPEFKAPKKKRLSQ